MAEHVVLLSIPQVRRRDVSPGSLSALDRLATHGGIGDLIPSIPGVSSAAFATLVTGTGPFRHGIIGSAFFDRAKGCVVGPPLTDAHVLADKLWDRASQLRPDARSMVWFAPNSAGASARYRAGIDEGGLRIEPPELADELSRRIGPFPAPLGGPPASAPRFETTAWILRSASYVLETERPDLAVIRLPLLGHVARRFGPDSREAARSILELNRVLSPFLATVSRSALVVAVTETLATPVSEPIDVNRVLRALGMLALTQREEGGLDIDTKRSSAFALVHHQICHIYTIDRDVLPELTAAFAGEESDGIRAVVQGAGRARLGLDHPRSGDLVLISHPDRWFRADWWRAPNEAPRGRPCASGLDSASLQLVSDPVRVQGSLGAPSLDSEEIGMIISSRGEMLRGRDSLRQQDVAELVLRALE